MTYVHLPKKQYSGTHPVLFFNLSHIIWQTMVGPPVLQKLSHRLAHIRGKFLNERSIARKSQLLELRHVLTAFPRKHLMNAYESVTSNILVTLHEGGGHRCNLCLEPSQKIRHGSIDGKLRTPSPKRGHWDLRLTPKLHQSFMKRILKLLHLRIYFSLFF
jgi:hypothetical protein